MKIKIKLLTALFACSAATALAMETQVVNENLILSGPVIQGDIDRFEQAVQTHPEIQVVVLRNSHGGHIQSGYTIGQRIRELGFSTVVSGYCVSSCSRMFLGGKERFFSDDYVLEGTYIGFHGHYGPDGRLNKEQVDRYGLFDWIVKYSDGKADPELVRRWISIERNNGMVAFLHPETKLFSGSERTFFCRGYERTRPLGCEAISADALKLGVITSLKIVRSPDR